MNVNLSNCDTEPIHIPNSIQYGAMLVLSNNKTVIGCSDNANDLLSLGGSPIGLHIDDVFDNFGPSGYVQLTRFDMFFECFINCDKEQIIINIEALKKEDTIAFVPTNTMLTEVQNSSICDPKIDIKESLNGIVNVIKKFTGFERVMVYKFDDDFTGKVVAEALKDGVESFMDHRFPAGDIPLPARLLYTKNILRTIPDILLDPIPISLSASLDKHYEIDMTYSVLRAVSPMHIEYLKNMGVRSTMSLSIVFDNKLWGLIACHSSKPTYIPFRMINGLEILARMFSKSIASHRYTMSQIKNSVILNSFSELSTRIKKSCRHNSFEQLLDIYIESFGNIITSSGVAIIYNNEIVKYGNVPSDMHIMQISTIANKFQNDNGFFATDSMVVYDQSAIEYKNSASGVVAILLRDSQKIDIYWFKPEVKRIEKWGGNPEKVVENLNGIFTISPRKSFETWHKTVELKSEAIQKEIFTTLAEVKKMMQDIIAVSEAQTSAREANQALQQSQLSTIAELASNIAHQWRQPLNTLSIAVQDLLITEELDELDSEYIKKFTFNSMDVIRYLSSTIENFRLLFKNEANKVNFGIGKQILEAYMFTKDILELSGIEIKLNLPVIEIYSEGFPGEFSQVILSILSNAKDALVKKNSSSKLIAVDVEIAKSSVVITIKDNGGGIPEAILDKIFEPYTTTKHKSQGAGLGMYAAKMLIEQNMGGVLSVQNDNDWAVFVIEMPLVSLEIIEQ